jgi:hypothetical protein
MDTKDECRRRKRREVLALEDFSDDDLIALESTRTPESAKAFDHESEA